MNVLFYGKEITEKAEIFKQELEEINQLHADYFNQRKETLHRHYAIHTANRVVTFAFLPNSTLDESIKDECLAAFNKVYAKPIK